MTLTELETYFQKQTSLNPKVVIPEPVMEKEGEYLIANNIEGDYYLLYTLLKDDENRYLESHLISDLSGLLNKLQEYEFTRHVQIIPEFKKVKI